MYDLISDIDTSDNTVLEWFGKNGIPILVILIISWLAYHFVGVAIDKLVSRAIRKTRFNQMTDDDIIKRQNTLSGLLTTVARVFILAVAAMMVFHQFFPSVDLAPLLASAGILGVALGFGAQSLVKDFLTGIFIISENQYRVGDVVEIDGASGTVEHVGIRSTVIRDTKGNVHYFPNGNIVHVINKTMGFSKVNFTLSVEPDTNVDKLSEIINDVGAKLAEEPKWQNKIIEAPKFLNIGSFSQLGMEVNIVGTTAPSEQWSVGGEMRRRLLDEFHKNKIKLATPVEALNLNAKKK